MTTTIRRGTMDDVPALINLALKSWSVFHDKLTDENRASLVRNLSNPGTYTDLLNKSESFICTTDTGRVIGMAFLMPSGNPTSLFKAGWSYIRMVTVDPEFGGLGIGRRLTGLCIEAARQNQEGIIALHTSELMDNARHLYETLGFKILKEVDPRLGKRYWLYLMVLNETPGSDPPTL